MAFKTKADMQTFVNDLEDAEVPFCETDVDAQIVNAAAILDDSQKKDIVKAYASGNGWVGSNMNAINNLVATSPPTTQPITVYRAAVGDVPWKDTRPAASTCRTWQAANTLCVRPPNGSAMMLAERHEIHIFKIVVPRGTPVFWVELLQQPSLRGEEELLIDVTSHNSTPDKWVITKQSPKWSLSLSGLSTC